MDLHWKVVSASHANLQTCILIAKNSRPFLPVMQAFMSLVQPAIPVKSYQEAWSIFLFVVICESFSMWIMTYLFQMSILALQHKCDHYCPFVHHCHCIHFQLIPLHNRTHFSVCHDGSIGCKIQVVHCICPNSFHHKYLSNITRTNGKSREF